MGITVAVTGPTGEIGISAVTALEAAPGVDRILGMARRPFHPSAHGWTRTEYRQGDILDRDAVDAFVAEADVVVHLAFLIMGSREQSRRINLDGTRNVFEATVGAPRPHRLVYTSSVAAYGYHDDNPTPLTEDVAPRGSKEHYYSEQKAECEQLLTELTAASDLEVYVLRPCIVAGPRATMLADSMPWNQLLARLPVALRRAAVALRAVRPLLPDPGTPVQLVHHDDVATAIVAAALGRGAPGPYNLAGDGQVSLRQVAEAVGARGVRVPRAAAVAASELLARLPRVPAAAEWVHVARTSVVMDTGRAKRELGWAPAYTSEQTLAAMAAAR
ncbi:MAG: NAD-dependent epimerase/dehydratase family protein [Jatrophihabitantaceae bacterium]